MAKQLSQAEIDALLSSLRQAQEDADAATGGPDPAAAAEATPWTTLGEPLAIALTELMAGAWRPHVPALSVVRGPALPAPAAAEPASRVVRLGAPLNQRVWFFWQGGGAAAAEAVDGFLAALQAVVHAASDHEALSPDTPLPADGLLLPFRGTAESELPLTLGLEGTRLRVLEDRLAAPGPTAAGGASPALGSGSGVPIEDLEVEASVYVGGGMYRLSSLAALRPGAVLPLATEVGEPAVIAIQGRVIAYGEVMVTRDDTLAVRLTRVVLGDEGRREAPVWLEQSKRDGAADRPRAAGPLPPPPPA